MGQINVHEFMSLDGVVENPTWTMEFGFDPRMGEAIELIRALWTGEKVTHKGLYYQTRQAKLYTRTSEPIPLYVSSMVPNSARFAGKHSDGLITVGGEEPATYHEMFENFETGAKEAGKWRLEGKEYVVQDGDVVHFRFNV